MKPKSEGTIKTPKESQEKYFLSLSFKVEKSLSELQQLCRHPKIPCQIKKFDNLRNLFVVLLYISDCTANDLTAEIVDVCQQSKSEDSFLFNSTIFCF